MHITTITAVMPNDKPSPRPSLAEWESPDECGVGVGVVVLVGVGNEEVGVDVGVVVVVCTGVAMPESQWIHHVYVTK